MLKFLTAMLSALTFSSLAYCGEVEGVIASINIETASFTLESGQEFMAGVDVDLDSLVEGKRVHITFEDGSDTATSVVPVF